MLTPPRTLWRIAPLLMLLLAASAAEVDAASALGRANATVVSPAIVAPINISIAMPSVISRSPVSSASTITTATVSTGGERPNTVTVAGVSIESLDGGTALSFSIAGDTTSAYVVQLTPNGAADLPGSAAGADSGGANGGSAASGSSSLILAAQPLASSGRLSIVLSQAPSELLAGAISLSVNYN